MTDTTESSQETDKTNLINIKSFQDKWSVVVDFSPESYKVKDSPLEAIANEIGLPLQTVEDLSALCSLETLLCGSEPEDKKHFYLKIPETRLKTLQYQSQDLCKRKDNASYQTSVLKQLKYNSNNVRFVHPSSQNREHLPEDKRIPTTNVVLTVNIHRPFQNKYTNQVMIDQVVLVHGDMYLTKFRDSIQCVNDLAVAGDFSENLGEAQSSTTAGEKFKSGFLFIEGTFYNDLRHADNRDYSQHIIDSLKKSNKGDPPYKTCTMENVKFSDLSIRLGEPYVYMHQGDCEHLISFSDIRMLSSDDAQCVDDYPFNVVRMNRRRVQCKACLMYTARWQVEGSIYTPVDPCYLCDGCLNSLHYDQDGNKVGHFKAFKFADSYSVL